MPAKKRPTKNTAAPAPAAAPVTPAVTPETVLASKKATAAGPASKPAAKKPAVKQPKVTQASEAAMIAVPVVADAPAVTERVAAPERVVAISEDDVRRQAYLLSQGRTGPRDPIADWFEAERQLRDQRAR